MSKTNFKTRVIVLELVISLFFLNSSALQGQEDSTVIKKIDSLIQESLYKTNEKDYDLSHTIRIWSEQHKYTKGIYQSHANLLWYHGAHRHLDSVNEYIKKMDRIDVIAADSSLHSKYNRLKGLTLQQFFDKPFESVQYYKKAMLLLPKLNNENYLNHEVQIQSGIALFYVQKEQFDKAIDLLEPYLQISSKLSIISKRHLYTRLVYAFQSKNLPEKSLPLSQELIKLADSETKFASYKNNITFDYYLNKEYQKAIDSALSIRPLVKKAYPNGLTTNSYNLALYYEAIKNYNKASFYMKDAIQNSNKKIELQGYYEKLAEYEEKLGNLEQAYTAEKKGRAILDSIRSTELTTYVNDTKKEIANINPLVKSNRAKLTLWISSIVAVCFLGWLLFYQQYLKKKTRPNKVETNKVNTHKLLEDFQKEKTNTIDIKKLFNPDPDEVISQKLEDSGCVFFIASLKKMYPDLTDTDIKHCFFIFAGMSLKETAQLLHVSVNTVKNARYRAKTRIITPVDMSFKEHLEDINKQHQRSS